MPAIDWDKLPLGQVPDYQIAKSLGCVAATVATHRKVRGIPAAMKTPQKFAKGAIASKEQLAARMKQWKKYPTTFDVCRQCDEDHYARNNLRGKLEMNTERRNTDQGVFCLKHYAALPVCTHCGEGASLWVDGLCEVCLRDVERLRIYDRIFHEYEGHYPLLLSKKMVTHQTEVRLRRVKEKR